MKTIINSFASIPRILIILVSLLMTSCEALKEDPLYAGTWEFKDKIYSGELTFNTTRTLLLTKNTYQEVYVIQPDNSSSISTILGLKGDLSVSGSEMTFSLKEIGACVKDAQEKCTSSVQWYGSGTQYYNDNIQYFKLTVKGDFEVDEDYLWIIRDTNGDGDTEDAGEDIEFESK